MRLSFESLLRKIVNRKRNSGDFNPLFRKTSPYTNNQRYGRLDYKIMSEFVINDIVEVLRNSYLKSIDRKILDGEEGIETYYVKPKK